MRSLRLFAPLTALLLSLPAHAAPTPAQLLQEALDRMIFRTSGAEMRIAMTLRDSRGEQQRRTFYAKSSRTEGQLRTLLRFLSPSSVAGTAFLLVQQQNQDPVQHMYLPALKTIKRIAGNQKHAKFAGSDFTYADLEWRGLDQASHRQLADQKVGKASCYVIQSTPRRDSPYSKLQTFIRKKDRVPLRVRFYGEGGRLIKTLYVKEVQRKQGVLLTTRIKLVDERSGHSTFLELEQVKLNQHFAPEEFTPQALSSR